MPVLATAMVVSFLGLAVPYFGDVVGVESTEPEDLRVERRFVPDHDNGFLAVSLQDPVYWPRDMEESDEAHRVSNGTSEDWELAAHVLARNADPLARFAEGLRRRDFQFPDTRDPAELIGNTTRWWRLIDVVAISIFHRARHDGPEAGLAGALEILRFGQRVQRGEGSLVQWIMGSAFKRRALSCIRELSRLPEVRSRHLVSLVQELEHFGADRPGFVHAAKFEMRHARAQFARVARGELELENLLLNVESTERPFDPQLAGERLAGVFRRVIDCANRPDWGLDADPQSWCGDENPDPFTGQSAKGWHLGLQEGAMEDVALAATRILLALRAHEMETGLAAQDLRQLVPLYLREVPIDPFDGKPLRYAPLKGIVYSVGKDRIDRGGSTLDNPSRARQDRSEPTFRVGF